ncbi:MAG: hypothetical protein NVSMB1_08570 [Polyangiales bacterium]
MAVCNLRVDESRELISSLRGHLDPPNVFRSARRHERLTQAASGLSKLRLAHVPCPIRLGEVENLEGSR